MRPSEFYRRCVQFNWAWRDRSEWGDNPNEEHQLRRIAEERPELLKILERAEARFWKQRCAAQGVR
jgi:hypothetical protein